MRQKGNTVSRRKQVLSSLEQIDLQHYIWRYDNRQSKDKKFSVFTFFFFFSIIECFGQNIICSNLQKLLDNAWSGFLLQTQRQQGYWVCTSMLEGIYIQETSRSKLCKLSHIWILNILNQKSWFNSLFSARGEGQMRFCGFFP